ncbi:hypothetical protein GCM10010910_03930 [Microbacterium nanhaiense]|uniref:DUF1643 domain-containing protein n=1 Tax=Microbacterium nanhaiense TaxID=1301026 RepID=A0ABQ2MY81_9MICO|nr:DUF1643 domain-containing protein [Microbacterium nanhaiense]GGO59885.1 hypothetical protein GCM10010910_03930 [Microbacterium nanhaiense]
MTQPDGWLYRINQDNTARYVLGTVGTNPLICVGVNPSTATPQRLDPTVTRVAKRARDSNFDSWIMLNLYPQRSTAPEGMHSRYLPYLKAQNEQHIAEVLQNGRHTLLAAWGELIETRDYLPEMLHSIASIAEQSSCDWMSIGSPLKRHHPRHPSRARYDMELQRFDMTTYLQRF